MCDAGDLTFFLRAKERVDPDPFSLGAPAQIQRYFVLQHLGDEAVLARPAIKSRLLLLGSRRHLLSYIHSTSSKRAPIIRAV
jgi:hypothetical protein